MEAQRYPHDFDGIAAGAPAGNMVVQNTFHHGWNVLASLDADGKYILLAGKLPLIHTAVLAACDALDGVTDGVLDDPRRCHFDPGSLVCPDTATCLTAAEAAVVGKLHDGATDAQGHRLEPAIAHEWGSELARPHRGGGAGLDPAAGHLLITSWVTRRRVAAGDVAPDTGPVVALDSGRAVALK